MKRVLVSSLLLAALGVVAPARAALCEAPRCVDLLVPVPATLKVPDTHVRVLLPDGYSGTGPGYPVLYLLHGAGDTYKTWSENTDIISFFRTTRVIIVMPDGGR